LSTALRRRMKAAGDGDGSSKISAWVCAIHSTPGEALSRRPALWITPAQRRSEQGIRSPPRLP